jgi:hypothetical protein
MLCEAEHRNTNLKLFSCLIDKPPNFDSSMFLQKLLGVHVTLYWIRPCFRIHLSSIIRAIKSQKVKLSKNMGLKLHCHESENRMHNVSETLRPKTKFLLGMRTFTGIV